MSFSSNDASVFILTFPAAHSELPRSTSRSALTVWARCGATGGQKGAGAHKGCVSKVR